MKKGYSVILSLTYRETVKIETEEDDIEKIKLEAKDAFNIDVWDRGRLDDIIDDVQVVKVKRNYSERPNTKLARKENTKTFIVRLNCRSVGIDHYVNAETEEDAVDHLEDDLTLEFTSEDGNTDCQVSHYDIECVEEVDFEKED